MTIVCATDFSEPATRAGTVAALLAARAREPLKLVYALEPASSFDVAGSLTEPARAREKAEANRLRKLGADVEEKLSAGVPDEVIVELVEDLGARLVVLGSLGRRAGSKWRLGSTADRTAQTSPVPVMVVRASDPFDGWSDARPLRVVMGADFSAMTDAVMTWTRWLCQLGPCEVIAAHVYFPPGERRRLGIAGPGDVGGGDPQIEAALTRDLSERIGPMPGARAFAIRPVASLGNTADRLVELAQQERADLVVVGAHQRSFLGRLWHGSVSEGVLEQAPMTVACVPERAADVVKTRVPDVRSVLAATDFSRAANAAIPHAYSVLAAGGTVHLVHVVEAASDLQALEARLRGLLPAEAAARKIETQVHVLEARSAADAICSLAERLGVGMVCLGAKARAGMVKAIVGSVAEAVIDKSSKPVMLVPAPKG